jgi:hypothetical protein
MEIRVLVGVGDWLASISTLFPRRGVSCPFPSHLLPLPIPCRPLRPVLCLCAGYPPSPTLLTTLSLYFNFHTTKHPHTLLFSFLRFSLTSLIILLPTAVTLSSTTHTPPAVDPWPSRASLYSLLSLSASLLWPTPTTCQTTASSPIPLFTELNRSPSALSAASTNQS